MESMELVLGVVLCLAFVLGPLVIAIYKKRIITRPYDKSVVYLAAEMSYAPELWGSVRKNIDYVRMRKITVPFASTWRGMVSHPFESLGRIGAIWYGLTFLSLFALAGVISTSLKDYAVEFMNFSLVLVFCLCWFMYYFRSVSAEITESAVKADIALGYLLELGWGNFTEEVTDTIKEEVKVDFELYKRESGVGGLIVILLSSGMLMYSRMSDFLSGGAVGIILILLSSIFISKWLYEGYRIRLIHISLNTILSLKKNIQLNRLHERLD